MILLICCGALLFVLASYGVGCEITDETGFIALVVGAVFLTIFLGLIIGFLYGLDQVTGGTQ